MEDIEKILANMNVSSENPKAIDLDFFPVASPLGYFKALKGCFEAFLSMKSETQNIEVEAAMEFIKKLLYTIEVLKMKYAHNKEDLLRIDTTDSGFPNFVDMLDLQVGMDFKEEYLKTSARPQVLKRQMIDHMFARKDHPTEILAAMCKRMYFEMLDTGKIFMCFTPGEIREIPSDTEDRRYVFSWGCYDKQRNMPYVHVMTFVQDMDSEPLTAGSGNYNKFLATVRNVGSEALSLMYIAATIDEQHNDIHPKVLKRTEIGPFLSEEFSRNISSDLKACFDLVEPAYRYVFCFEDEIVFSVKQVRSNKFFSLGALREIFFISPEDAEAFERKVSVIKKYVLVPHRLAQHLGGLFEGRRRIPFNVNGGA